ncbi:MAG: ribonuclease H-like domain-containing protein [Bryobacteraceae bacterium]|nr:ribonuclease H-like domain-containing protein [Bryobacteraceae bacterium]
MTDLSKQLDELRQRIARLEHRELSAGETSPGPLLFDRRADPASRNPAEGREVETEFGRHWELERSWPANYRHGLSDVGALSEIAPDILCAVSGDERIEAQPERWAFLDTETTGLAGGSGTVAFLVGVGVIAPDGFRLKQYFLREPAEEASMLSALAGDLAAFDVLITYNGKSFDVPLLETRFVMNRRKAPFTRLQHVDLLYGARRLWRLKLDSCRLQELEKRILGHERVGDVGGGFIPNLYFDYLRNGDAGPLEPVLFHNAIDILSLACLTAIVPQAIREPERLKHGEELAGLARWFGNEDRLEEAASLMQLALKKPMSDELVWETLWRLAGIERKLGRHDTALAHWSELSTIANPYQAQALERMAMHYERREKNAALALEFTRAALAIARTPELEKREARLEARLSRPRSGRLL